MTKFHVTQAQLWQMGFDWPITSVFRDLQKAVFQIWNTASKLGGSSAHNECALPEAELTAFTLWDEAFRVTESELVKMSPK